MHSNDSRITTPRSLSLHLAQLSEQYRNGACAPRQWDDDPREADPVIHGRSWVAWAVGPNGAKVSGKGESPEDALLQLTVELKRVSA